MIITRISVYYVVYSVNSKRAISSPNIDMLAEVYRY